MDVHAYVEFCCISIISPLADQMGKKEVRLLELSPIVLIRGSSLMKDYSLYLVTPLPQGCESRIVVSPMSAQCVTSPRIKPSEQMFLGGP